MISPKRRDKARDTVSKLHTWKSAGGIRRASYEAPRGGRGDGKVPGGGGYPDKADLGVLHVYGTSRS